ncbi:MAG: Uncharacterised protein [Prochlorococcus marinus str. MIT 9313]|nr:MAG: Uncharacterised protein [Prochlorococcus marinus str. MIT 9313]
MGLGVMNQPSPINGPRNRIQQARKIKGLGLHQVEAARLKQLCATNEILKPSHTEHTHQLAHLLSYKQKEVDNMLRDTWEALAQALLLGSNPHRTLVGMTDASHDAALGNHRD